jgi:RND family efflux transporter MFP subunit
MKPLLTSIGGSLFVRASAAASSSAKQANSAKTRRWRSWLLPALAAAAVATGYLLLRPQPLEAVHPRIGPAITSVYASGTVEASVMLPLAPRVGGRLVMLRSDEHSRIRKGLILAQLEDIDVNSNIAQLEANAAFARTDLERYTRLRQENAIAPQTYDRALASWKTAAAAVRQAKAQAGYMTLRAPDDCEVIQRDGEVGQFIAANTPIFWLSCHSHLRISALVDEEDVSMVKPGQPVLIRADAFAGRTFQAQVTEITPKGDAVGRSYRVRIELPVDTPLQIGMTTESNIIVRKNDRAILVPAQAIARDRVWKVVGDKAVQVRVTTGAKNKDWTEIRSGISANDTLLRDGGAKPGNSPTIRLVQP